jgi:hypothetical protein
MSNDAMQTFYDIGTTDEISDFFSYPGCDSSPGSLPGPFLSGMWQCRCIRESIQRDNECVLCSIISHDVV